MTKPSVRSVKKRPARTSQKEKRERVQRVPTKHLLLDAAERLFASYGLEGISLREIAAAAGQANTNVVQYHFANKEGLVAAILNDRVQKMEEMRKTLLEAFGDEKEIGSRDLLRMIWAPFLMLRSPKEGYVFCRFFLYYMLHSEIARHPVFMSLSHTVFARHDPERGAPGVYQGAEESFPYVITLVRLLRSRYKDLPADIYTRRFSSLTLMFLASVAEYDYSSRRAGAASGPEFDIEPILDMAVSALEGPCRVPAKQRRAGKRGA